MLSGSLKENFWADSLGSAVKMNAVSALSLSVPFVQALRRLAYRVHRDREQGPKWRLALMRVPLIAMIFVASTC